jgi:hypothetical protein
MSAPHSSAVVVPLRLRSARVLRVKEHECEALSEGDVMSVKFAPMFPSPRVERVSPGHLIAIATGPNGVDAVVWRWYDAVVLGQEDAQAVRLWEPAHGEIVAQARKSYEAQEPGSRAYASAGLPGAEWWVAVRVPVAPDNVAVELDAVEALYSANNLWPAVFELGT